MLSLTPCGHFPLPRLGRLRSMLLLPQLLAAGLAKASPWQPAASPPTDPVLPGLRSRPAALHVGASLLACSQLGRQHRFSFTLFRSAVCLFLHPQSQDLEAELVRVFPHTECVLDSKFYIFTKMECSEKVLI